MKVISRVSYKLSFHTGLAVRQLDITVALAIAIRGGWGITVKNSCMYIDI